MRRTRRKSNLRPVQEVWTVQFNGGTPYNVVRDTEWFSSHSVMNDGIHGNTRPKPNRPESECVHVKYTTSGNVEYTDPPLVWTGAGANRFDITPPDGPVSFPSSSVPELPESIAGYKFQKFLEDAFQEFTEQFNEEVSLANFIVELKDFRSVLDEAKQLFFGRGGHNGGMLRSISEFLHGRAKNGIGGNFLDIELNWKSFISDLPKIWDSYSIAMKRLEFLAGHQRFTTHKRRRYMIEPETEGFNSVRVDNLAELDQWLGAYSIWLVPAQCQVTYNASAFVDNHLQLSDINTWWAVADVLGLNNLPKIVWNAVKLSWVADMFVDTSAFLDAFEVEAYSGKLVVTGGNASYKVVRFYDIVLRTPTDTDIPYETKEEIVGSLRAVSYLRTPVSLIRPSLLSLKPDLNTHQKQLLASLGDAQLGLTSKGYKFTSEYVSNFRKNKATFGKSYWKRVSKSGRPRRLN
jgi:hypothetical protein